MGGTVAIPRPASATTPELAPGWKVVIHDDDVTPMDLVTLALQHAAGLSLEVAEMVMLEAHRTGSAVVRRGLDRDAAGTMAERLHALTRIDGVCPGVRAEALADG